MGLKQKILSFFCCTYKNKKNCSALTSPHPSLPMATPIQNKTSKITNSPQLVQNLDSESWTASTLFHHVCFASGCITILITLAKCISLALMSARLGPWLELVVVALAAYILADLASGIYHWAVDNYGSPQTPLFGAQIEIFLVHHLHPMAITKRHVSRLLHVPSVVVTFFVMPINLVSCDSVFLGFVFVFSGCLLFSQLFHAWAHTPKGRLSKVILALQDAEVVVGRAEHARHHRPPFDSHYCIVNGGWNAILDKSGFFSGLERLIFKAFGTKPRSWTNATFG